MREIKFRAWDEDGFMFTPTHIEFNKLRKGDTWVWNGRIFGQLGSSIIDLMMYTGIKDKNDEEVCEGDILKIGSTQTIVFVVWNEVNAMFDLMEPENEVMDEQAYDKTLGELISDGEGSSVEIIGNIYDDDIHLKIEEYEKK